MMASLGGLGSALRRAATVMPAVPPPTMRTSWCSDIRKLPSCGRLQRCAGLLDTAAEMAQEAQAEVDAALHVRVAGGPPQRDQARAAFALVTCLAERPAHLADELHHVRLQDARVQHLLECGRLHQPGD